MKSAINWLGLVEDDRYLETDAPDEPAASQPTPPSQPQPKPPSEVKREPVKQAPVKPSGFVGDNSPTMLLTTNLVLTPADYTGIQPVVDRCRSGLPTVMNLRMMPINDAKRSVDFCSGVLYALEGEIKRVARGVFLLTPAGAVVERSVVENALMDIP